MACCTHCSAPLQPNDRNCKYCGVRNDVDLHGRVSYSSVEAESDRHCPNCEIPLETIDLKIGGQFHIERCRTCHGLFFDMGEIEEMLEHSVSNDSHINHELLTNVSKDRYKKPDSIKYRKCPVCQSFMARRNFGHRSGVVIDRCPKHGIWMDSGELIHLLEWKKAGGQILHDKVESQKPAKQTPDLSSLLSDKPRRHGSRLDRRSSGPLDVDLEDLVGDAFSSLVKGIFG